MNKAFLKIFSATLVFLSAFVMIHTDNSLCVDKSNFKLDTGDEIMVRIPVEPKFSGKYVIDEQGQFFLPLIEGIELGAFVAKGKTISEIEKILSDRLSEYFIQTEATVSLVSMGIRPGRSVSVIGEVFRPDNFNFYDGFTLVDAIIKSANVKPNADISNIVVQRRGSPPINIDARNILNGTDMTNNILLKAGDYVIVPGMTSHMQIKIVVLGMVSDPGSYTLPEGSQVIDAISAAQGTIGRAGIGKSYIIRSVNGRPTVIHTDLKALIQRADLKENVELMDGDIVFVPESSGYDIMNKVSDILNLNLLKNIIKDDF